MIRESSFGFGILSDFFDIVGAGNSVNVDSAKFSNEFVKSIEIYLLSS